MKVTCESCGSKYTIKDDKVRGKRVKIRCKGCKSPIVVDGLSIDGSSSSSDSENAPAYSDVPEAPDGTGLASAQGTFPATAPLGAEVERWSVNLSETDSRDMTTDEIVAAWNSGLVTDDAYIYKPGFDDWKPILEVPELARLVTGAGAPDTFSPPAGNSPFAAKAAASRAATSGRRGDLFGGVAAAGSEDDVGAHGPPLVIPSNEGKATGARNESSVLFSLDALKAGFAAPEPAPAAPARNDDPFGLGAAPSLSLGGGFDQNAALFAPPPPEPKKPKKISLPPSIAPGAAAAGGIDRSKLIMIAAGVLVLLLAVGGVGYALGGSDSDKDESGEQAGLEKEEPAKASEGSSKSDAEEKQDKDKDKAEAKAKDSAEAKQADAAEEKSDEKDEAEKPAEETAKTDAEKAHGTQAAATKSTTATSTKTGTATKSTKTEAPKADSSAPPFNKAAAISALSSAAGSAAGCKVPGGPTGTGRAIVTFAPSGRVTSANVSGGKFGGTSVGGCVASRFRSARVPPFSGNAVTVSKSFTVP